MSSVAQAPPPSALAISTTGRAKLLLCLFGSIAAHALFVGLSPVLFPRPLANASDSFVIEAWPESAPAAPEDPVKVAVPEAREEAPKPVRAEPSAPRPPPTAADVSRAVQHKGMLRAFAALGGAAAGPLTGGLGNGLPTQGVAAASMGPAELPGGAPASDRGGDGPAGPATLGAIRLQRGSGPGPGMGGNGEVVGASVVGMGGSVNSSLVSEVEVTSFVRARTGGIKACYESQLRREPTLQGRMRVRFRILEDGTISQVSALENTLASSEVEACVFNVIRGWRTPFRPSEAADVEYPFVFSLR